MVQVGGRFSQPMIVRQCVRNILTLFCVQVLLCVGRKACTGDVGLQCVGVECSQEYVQLVHIHFWLVCSWQVVLNYCMCVFVCVAVVESW